MFQGFSKEASDFLLGIRLNNTKEWFEPRKNIYIEMVYEPLKALGEEIFRPFSHIDGMMYKVGRIYRDESFPPYLHYRDTLWIYVRRNALYWSKTPTLYFELSPDGAEFGFRISAPTAAVMERFRSDLSDDAKPFLELIEGLESLGMTVGGDEYKRPKKCTTPEAERFFAKKNLSCCVKITDKRTLYSRALAERVIKAFTELLPLYDYFCELVEIDETVKAITEQSPEPESTINAVKAPDVEFMW